MTSSTQKLAQLRPQVTAELESLLIGNSQVGFLLRPVLASIRPLLDAKVDSWLASDPAQVDHVLGELAGTLLALRSDDAPPVDVAAALERLQPAQLLGLEQPVPFEHLGDVPDPFEALPGVTTAMLEAGAMLSAQLVHRLNALGEQLVPILELASAGEQLAPDQLEQLAGELAPLQQLELEYLAALLESRGTPAPALPRLQLLAALSLAALERQQFEARAINAAQLARDAGQPVQLEQPDDPFATTGG